MPWIATLAESETQPVVDNTIANSVHSGIVVGGSGGVSNITIRDSGSRAVDQASSAWSLPMYPELTSDQIATVTGAIREFFDGLRTRS